MRRELAELGGSGMLAATLLGWTVVVLATGGVPAPSPDQPDTPLPISAPQAAGDAARYGRMLFLAKGCNGCHSVTTAPGVAQVGPDLTRLSRTAGMRRLDLSAEEYVSESLLEPQAFIAPGYEVQNVGQMPRLALSDAEVQALVAFLLAPDDAR